MKLPAFPLLKQHKPDVEIDFTKATSSRPAAPNKHLPNRLNVRLLVTFFTMGSMASLALHKDEQLRRTEILESYHQGYEIAKDASYKKILKGENVAGYTRLIAQMNREESCMDKLGSDLTEHSARACLQ